MVYGEDMVVMSTDILTRNDISFGAKLSFAMILTAALRQNTQSPKVNLSAIARGIHATRATVQASIRGLVTAGLVARDGVFGVVLTIRKDIYDQNVAYKLWVETA